MRIYICDQREQEDIIYICDFWKTFEAALCLTKSINLIDADIFSSNMKINGTYRSNGIIMEVAKLI